MGCFLACFGSSKDRRRKEQSIRRAQPRVQRCPSFKAMHVQLPVPLEPVSAGTAVVPVNEFQCKDELVEQLSLNIQKRVTFDSNVKTYEHVRDSLDEVTDCAQETNNGVIKEESLSLSEDLVKSVQTQSSSEDSSVTSAGSYPPSHRYQNCRESDDEGEDMESGMSDIDEDEDDGLYEDDDDGDTVQLRSEISADQVITEEVHGTEMLCGLPEEKVKPIGSNRSARDRSLYVHPVLNPVENLSQWKAVKAKGKPQAMPQKENLISDQEQDLKELPFSFKPKRSQTKSSDSEISVDASLSNWLVSSEATTPLKGRTSTFDFDACTPTKMSSPGSNSVTSHDDRPILGALTVDEIRQFSATSSPRKSPSRSPEDMPIIGTVGTYWSNKGPDSGSSSSFKGIPNTTSKYREERKVNWHSTPFETRLERALERRGGAQNHHSGGVR